MDFALDPQIAFLNHGSFGARPRAVLEAQNRRRAEFESHPIQWLDRNRKAKVDRAKTALAPHIGAQPNDFGFVTNATGGINAVLRSLTFKPGDELLTVNHVYNAVRKTMSHIADRCGGRYIELEVPLPLQSPRQIVDAIARGLTDHTRIVVIDHITSPTAVIFPVDEIVRLCTSAGVDVLIDGAHAPGMIPLNVERIGCAYYAANLHKWMCAPVGVAFLWVRPDRQRGIHPTTISHFLDEDFAKEFEWQGTRDITAWLCIEDSLAYFETLGGLDRIMQHNHAMAVWMQQMLCEKWRVEPATPLNGSMIGSMATVALPQGGAGERLRSKYADILAMRHALYDEHRIEAPIVEWMNRWWIRPCCQIYNTPEQYERLASAILKMAR